MSPQVWYPIYDIITFTALITNQFATSTFIQVDISKGQNMSDPALLMKKNEQHKSAQNCLVGHLHLSILSWPSSWSARSDWLMNKIGDRKMGNCCSHPWVSRGYHVGITIAMGGKIVIIVCLPKIATLGSIVDLTLQKQARILIIYIYTYHVDYYMYIYIIMIIWYGDIYKYTHIMLTASWFWQPGVKKWWWTRSPSRWPPIGVPSLVALSLWAAKNFLQCGAPVR